jgi:hypothetical protein
METAPLAIKLSGRWLQQPFSPLCVVTAVSQRGLTSTEIQFRLKLRGAVTSASLRLCDDVIVYQTLGVWRGGSVTRGEDGGSTLKSEWVDTAGSSGLNVSHWECSDNR